jgi:hypothetical protein
MTDRLGSLFRRTRSRRPWPPPLVPTPLKLLVGTVVLALVAVGIGGQLEKARRTAEADVEILAADLQVGDRGGYNAVPSGWHLRYRFTVAGATYLGAAFRNWTLPSIQRAKVCFDPGNPRNQILVLRPASCPR